MLALVLMALAATTAGPTPRPPALWSPQDTADYLGVPVKTLYSWRHRDRGPRTLKVGRHLRYRPADVETWLAEQNGEGAA
jgi:excisionase family DNA binding protein